MATHERTIEAFKQGLMKLAEDAPPDFTGAAVVLYDSNAFPKHCHCDLRDPTNFFGETLPFATLRDGFVNLLCSIAVETHSCHDGFVLVNENGEVTHIAQYFVPPIVPGIFPHSEHGTRFYSAICGSLLPGVMATGVVCVNRDLFIMVFGAVVFERSLQARRSYLPLGEGRSHRASSHGGSDGRA